MAVLTIAPSFTLFQLDYCHRRQGKWYAMPHVQTFMVLYHPHPWAQRNFYSVGRPFCGIYSAVKKIMNDYSEGQDKFVSVFQTLTLAIDLSWKRNICSCYFLLYNRK